MAALSGRPPRPKPAHRFAAAGGALLAVGIVLLAFADRHRAAFIIGGTVTTVIGVLLLAPLAIRLLAAFARRSPIAVTLALRDLSRYQARSGAALGAITLAIGIAATIAVSASAADKPAGPGNLATTQLVIYTSRGGPGDPLPLLSASQLDAAQASVEQVATQVARLRVAPRPGLPPAHHAGVAESGRYRSNRRLARLRRWPARRIPHPGAREGHPHRPR